MYRSKPSQLEIAGAGKVDGVSRNSKRGSRKTSWSWTQRRERERSCQSVGQTKWSLIGCWRVPDQMSWFLEEFSIRQLVDIHQLRSWGRASMRPVRVSLAEGEPWANEGLYISRKVATWGILRKDTRNVSCIEKTQERAWNYWERPCLMTTQGIVVSSKITREESLKPKEISRHFNKSVIVINHIRGISNIKNSQQVMINQLQYRC